MANNPFGLVVPIPTYPAFVTIKFVAVELPITNEGPVMPSGLIDNNPQGEVEAMPKRLLPSSKYKLLLSWEISPLAPENKMEPLDIWER